jgi:hypothetical protein
VVLSKNVEDQVVWENHKRRSSKKSGREEKRYEHKRRRGKFIGHILRHSSQLKTVSEGEMSGKNYRGPRIE